MKQEKFLWIFFHKLRKKLFFFGFDNSTILHFDRNTKYLWERFNFQKRSQSNRANVSMSANWTLQQEETQINIIVFLLRITKGELVGSFTIADMPPLPPPPLQ